MTPYFFGLELSFIEDQGISSLAGESVIWKCSVDIRYSSLEFRKEVRAKHNMFVEVISICMLFKAIFLYEFPKSTFVLKHFQIHGKKKNVVNLQPKIQTHRFFFHLLHLSKKDISRLGKNYFYHDRWYSIQVRSKTYIYLCFKTRD